MLKTNYKRRFYKAVEVLENCADVNIKNKQGVVMEFGMAIDDNAFITYHLEEGKINFYHNDDVILSFGDNSPLISMFEGLIFCINEE